MLVADPRADSGAFSLMPTINTSETRPAPRNATRVRS
jgi:hypothetical protein